MRYSLRVLPSAWRDADSIFEWIAQRSRSGAERWFAAFLAAAAELRENALVYSVTPEGEYMAKQVRQRLFRTPRGRAYRMLFVVERDEVLVVRIRGPGQPPLNSSELPGTS